MKLTGYERLRHVARMRTNNALEGLLPDETDLLELEGYISGELSLGDMLASAREYADASQLKEHRISMRTACAASEDGHGALALVNDLQPGTGSAGRFDRP